MYAPSAAWQRAVLFSNRVWKILEKQLREWLVKNVDSEARGLKSNQEPACWPCDPEKERYLHSMYISFSL